MSVFNTTLFRSVLLAGAAGLTTAALMAPAPPAHAGVGPACEESPGLECGSGSSTGGLASTALGVNADASGTFATAVGADEGRQCRRLHRDPAGLGYLTRRRIKSPQSWLFHLMLLAA